ncbi:unnamed protein product [Lepeophtheirus salmonis]|uniref:(salmon louse) hypothetical protein n=1 Tax=Lepeophtheirus salmonis TaxID=72036 RepID=A0A7R8CY20_LEPSM|nr:unnamed protein product [Lepeophtheirus salmonis]CAF2966757.1 unnamed protein product [Lepeophtheirus salmonis]
MSPTTSSLRNIPSTSKGGRGGGASSRVRHPSADRHQRSNGKQINGSADGRGRSSMEVGLSTPIPLVQSSDAKSYENKRKMRRNQQYKDLTKFVKLRRKEGYSEQKKTIRNPRKKTANATRQNEKRE